MKISTALKKHQKKDQELEIFKENLDQAKELCQLAENKLSEMEAEITQNQDSIRSLENDKLNLQIQLDKEKGLMSELKVKLEEQEQENIKLLEIIDKQKFDLDEARSGLRYHTASPILVSIITRVMCICIYHYFYQDKKSLNINKNNGESSFAQEQIMADQLKKINLLEKENAEYKDKISLLEKENIEYKDKITLSENEYKDKINLLEKENIEYQNKISEFEEQLDHGLYFSITINIISS